MTLLHKLNQHFAANVVPLALERDLADAYGVRDGLPVRNFPDDITISVDDDDWQWILGVCFGDWVTRLWIVQEQLLNQQLVLMHGQHLLPWEDTMMLLVLCEATIIPPHLSRRHMREHLGRFSRYLIDSIFAMWLIRNSPTKADVAAGNSPMSLLNNHTLHGDLDCQDPRDHIYALLGISFDASDLDIMVDYSMAVSKVFHTASKAILQNRPVRDYLAFATMHGNDTLGDPDAISWALHRPTSRTRQVASLRTRQYSAHPRAMLGYSPTFRESDRVLVMKGRVVDCIHQASRPFYSTPSFLQGVLDLDWVKTWLRVVQSTRDILSECDFDIANVSAVASMVTAGMDFASKVNHTERAHHLCAWLRVQRAYVDDRRVRSASYGRFSEELHDVDAFIANMSNLLRNAGSKHSDLNEHCMTEERVMSRYICDNCRHHGRTMCLTRTSRFCAVMNGAEVGDVLVALEGSTLFYCLRPTDRLPSADGKSRYLAIGSAWIDGLMHGAAYEGLDPDDDYEIEIV